MLDHIGIACYKKEVKKIITFFELLDYKVRYSAIVKEYQVKCIFLYNNKLTTEIELVIPMNNKSAISNYLNRGGNKLHHIAFTVDNLEKFKGKLKPIRVKGAKPNMYVTFLDPKKYGMLIELVQYD